MVGLLDRAHGNMFNYCSNYRTALSLRGGGTCQLRPLFYSTPTHSEPFRHKLTADLVGNHELHGRANQYGQLFYRY